MISTERLACSKCGNVEFTENRGITLRKDGQVILLPNVRTRECLSCGYESLMPSEVRKIEELAELVGYEGEIL